MDNRDLGTAFGEWLCDMLSHPLAKAAVHAGIRNEYERDYIYVTNLYDGFGYTSTINMETIDGAKEWYIQNNKSLLEISPLTDDRKKEVSKRIEANAETLKQIWITSFKDRGISIIE